MEGKGRNRLVFVQLIQQKSIQVSLLGCFFVAHFVFPSENRISFLIPHAFRFAVITKEIKKNIKGNSSKNQGRNAVTRSAIGIDSIESSKIFDNADEEASFPGGIAACMKYIADNFRYPNIQGDCSIQGKIVVTFTVNEDGNLSDIKVKKSVYSDLDKEAVRVVKSMPSWIPAKQNGKAVKSRYTLPVYIHVQ